MVENIAASCGEFAHCRPWQDGTLTNSTVQFKSVIRLPDVIVFLSAQNSVLNTHKAVSESAKMLIPTIGVVDSDVDPRLITYPVPANDDSSQSISYLGNLFAQAILKGKDKRKAYLSNATPN